MRSAWLPLVIAAAVTVLAGTAVATTPHFESDLHATRALQTVTGDPGWWATPVSRLAPAPGKYYVMAITLAAAYLVAGWRGLALLAAVLLIEQYGAESTKAIFKRPRPSRELIATYGNFTGFTFPSTTITFFCATFGSVAILATVRRKAPYRALAMALGFGMIALASVARVVLGAHWPSDVVFTVLICLVWIWAAARVVLSNA